MNSEWNKVGLCREKFLLNLVLMAVFWNSSYCVADELVAKE